LVPVDDREVVLKGQQTPERPCLVDHRQARAQLNEQQGRVAGVRRPDADPLPVFAELHGFATIDFHLVSIRVCGWRVAKDRHCPDIR